MSLQKYLKPDKPKIDVNNIDQLAVWCHILGKNVSVGEKFSNPLRVDHTPNCCLKIKNNNLVFYDKPTEYLHGKTCFSAWMTINNVNYPEALKQITAKVSINTVKRDLVEKVKPGSVIIPHVKIWSKEGIKWWREYGITDLTNIFEINGYDLNEKSCSISRLGFAYLYNKNIKNELLSEQDWKWKIYQPKGVLNGIELASDWLSNVTKDLTWFTDNRSKESNTNKLIFSKSAKCQRVHESILADKFSYLHPQGEIINKSYPHIDLLKEFDEIVLWFDNDKVGTVCSDRFYNVLIKDGINCRQVYTSEFKDVSDMRKEVGLGKVKVLYKEVGLL